MSSSLHNTMLTYAHQDSPDGPLVHISQADNSHTYFCPCPECGKQLIPKNREFEGRKKSPHYAHKDDTSCQGAQMSALHSLAEQIIAKEKTLKLPPYHFCDGTQKDNPRISFTDVVLEETKYVDSKQIRPDCACYFKNSNGSDFELWVEIFVSHQVDENKHDIIRKSGKYCIEIDLSDFYESHSNDDSDFEDELKKVLIEISNDRYWLSCPHLDQENERKIAERAERERAEHERMIQEQQQAEAMARLERKKTNDAIDSWFASNSQQDADALFEIIRKAPYEEDDYVYGKLVCKRLTHDKGIVDFIQTSSKNPAGLFLFDKLIFYYYKEFIPEFDVIKEHIKKFQYSRTPLNHDGVMTLRQYTFAFFVLTFEKKLQKERFSYDYPTLLAYYLDKLRKNEEIKKNIFICCSFLYHHVLSQNIHDYPTLIKFVVEKKPELAKFCLMAVNYVSKYPDNYKSPDGHDWLIDLRQCAEKNKCDYETLVILNTVYYHTFKEEKYEQYNFAVYEQPAESYQLPPSPKFNDLLDWFNSTDNDENNNY